MEYLVRLKSISPLAQTSSRILGLGCMISIYTCRVTNRGGPFALVLVILGFGWRNYWGDFPFLYRMLTGWLVDARTHTLLRHSIWGDGLGFCRWEGELWV